jgi:hypothetical protein
VKDAYYLYCGFEIIWSFPITFRVDNFYSVMYKNGRLLNFRNNVNSHPSDRQLASTCLDITRLKQYRLSISKQVFVHYWANIVT